MIAVAQQKDKQIFYSFWKKYFSFDDGGYTDYFFDAYYDSCCHYMLIDQEVISIASVCFHEIVFDGKKEEMVMIFGVATKEEYRHKGHMDTLIRHIISQYKDKMIFLQAYHPEIYKHLGFEVVYHQKYYELSPLPSSLVLEEKEGEPEVLCDIYRDYCASFDGFALRDVDDFKKLCAAARAMGGSFISFYEEERPVGYGEIYKNGDHIIIEELCGDVFKIISYLRKHFSLTYTGPEVLNEQYRSIDYNLIYHPKKRQTDKELFFHEYI